MKFKQISALLLIAVFLSAGALFAQEAPKEAPKAEEPKALVDVSGVLFLDWAYFMKDEVTATDEAARKGKEGTDAMRLMRAYLTFSKKFDDVWSMKVTLDGAGLGNLNEFSASDTDSDGTFEPKEGSNSVKATNIMFLKNAYVEMKQKMDPIELKLQYGIVGTPVIGIIDSISGARWIYQNYMDNSKDILGGNSMDVSSADMGLKGDLNIMKMVTITGMYSNGDGYRYTEEQKDSDKAYWGVLSITPIKELYLNGYYHKRDIFVAGKDDDEVNYYGGSLAWSDKSFKVGANYFIGERDSETLKDKQEYTVYDIYANINLAEVAGVPVLVYGRYAMGEMESDATGATDVKKVESNTYYVGLGYQFSKNVQAMVVYQSKTDEEKKVNGTKTELTDETIWVKTETKF